MGIGGGHALLVPPPALSSLQEAVGRGGGGSELHFRDAAWNQNLRDGKSLLSGKEERCRKLSEG